MPAGVPADGVDAVAGVVGGRELVVCDRDVARSAPASVTPEEVSGRARQAYRACWCRSRRRRKRCRSCRRKRCRSCRRKRCRSCWRKRCRSCMAVNVAVAVGVNVAVAVGVNVAVAVGVNVAVGVDVAVGVVVGVAVGTAQSTKEAPSFTPGTRGAKEVLTY